MAMEESTALIESLFPISQDTKMAMEESAALIESKMGKQLKKFLKKNIVDKGISEELAVIDRTLGGVIKEKLGKKHWLRLQNTWRSLH